MRRWRHQPSWAVSLCGDALWLLVLFLPCSFVPPVNRVADGLLYFCPWLSLARRASVHSHLFVGANVVPADDRAR